ncbi:VanZ family protein [Virgibacillus proomii]|uniref:VanZ family protein n=1 Tax=Virgibacillus proomii TaxID=84407 RepID=UPI001C11D27B|nr:VanZ family protein [Virgibacillus proomii]MBU5267550.1 VanZ family protein [Virgibacillus proomii]
MEKSKNNQNKITAGLLAVYLFVLTWIILFKMQFSFQDLPDFRGINLIPFAGSVIVNDQIDFNEIIWNVLAFIPFGIYISMLKPNWSFLKKIAVIAGVSLLFEVLQFIFAIGGSDITDLMGNTLGGIIGVGVYIVFCKLFSTKANKILNVLASIGTICILALVLLLISGFIIYKFHVIGELLFMKINRGYTINDFDTAGSLFIKQE